MDKTEQILEALNKMNTKMDEGFKDVNAKFDGLQGEMMEEFRKAHNERQEMKSSINKIEVSIENDVIKNINLLVEGQQNINSKIDEVLKFKDEKELLVVRIEILENEITRMKARLDEIA